MKKAHKQEMVKFFRQYWTSLPNEEGMVEIAVYIMCLIFKCLYTGEFRQLYEQTEFTTRFPGYMIDLYVYTGYFTVRCARIIGTDIYTHKPTDALYLFDICWERTEFALYKTNEGEA